MPNGGKFLGLFASIITVYAMVILMNFLVRGYAARNPDKPWVRGLLFDA